MANSIQIFKPMKYPESDLGVFAQLVITIDSDYTDGNNYYSQVVLEKCKHIVKEK